LQRVVPAFRVADLPRSCEFYVEGLDFRIDWVWREAPELPAFAQISCGGLGLYLTQRAGDSVAGGLAYLYVDDVDEWAERARLRGLAIESGPCDEPWGNRELALVDPDGNRLVIATPLPRG
jgi:catechol 2,3-dioxygenase-like lactoylglutathione lyase family enzyme